MNTVTKNDQTVVSKRMKNGYTQQLIKTKLNIGIVGLGVVGSACKYGFMKLGHNIYEHDLKLNTSLKDLKKTDICYICVPTPSNSDGSCDSSIVEKVVNQLANMDYKGIVALKSTVTPGTTKRLKESTNLKMCFVPEFLRERCAISDFTENHDLLAIGTSDEDIYHLIKQSHGKFPKKVVKLSTTEAELLKYYSNVFNALRITFANAFYEISTRLNANYTKIKDAFMLRGTTVDMYMDVNENFRGYAGVCLPKDTAAIAALVKDLKLDLTLFETIERDNKKYKKTVFEGMRL